MSKLAIILCIVFIASATHAVYGHETFIHVNQTVWDNIKSEITTIETRVHYDLRVAKEIFNKLKKATTHNNATLTSQSTRSRLKECLNKMKYFSVYYEKNFLVFENVTVDLNVLEDRAIRTTSVCNRNLLALGYTILYNMIKYANDMIGRLEGLKENLAECGNGISRLATKCNISVILVSVDDIKMSYNNIPLSETNLANLTKTVKNINTLLTECITDWLNGFIVNSTKVRDWTWQCINSHIRILPIVLKPKVISFYE